ncbi:prepilin peptidase [Glaciecola siphonariae]|uniref:Prepilin leader peptidase/N-methyltransferase n=1 Tax=Glaciecola siphonariae TaxID=521012 RepID=A0ABV9LWC3_9ALTE
MLSLIENSPTFFIAFTFVLSLLVGSFLNVVIYRIPVMMKRGWEQEIYAYQNPEAEPTSYPHANDTFNLVKPDSRCPKCQHKIRAWENIPVLSWLALGGKCSQCKTPISKRYPAIELLTAVLSALVAWQLGYAPITLAFIVGTWLLVAMTFIDIDEMLLPDTLTLSLLWLGLLTIAVFEPSQLFDAVIGAAAGYMSLFTVYWAFKLLTGKEGMGFGDFKLLAALGVWVGWQHLPIIILLSSVVGAIVGIGLMIAQKKGRTLAIPFGPYLAAAGYLTVLYGDAIATWYLNTLI